MGPSGPCQPHVCGFLAALWAPKMLLTPFRVTLLPFFPSADLLAPEFNFHNPWGLFSFSTLSQLIPKQHTTCTRWFTPHIWDAALVIFSPEVLFPAPELYDKAALGLNLIPIIVKAPYAQLSSNPSTQDFKKAPTIHSCCSVVTGSVSTWTPLPNSYVIFTVSETW